MVYPVSRAMPNNEGLTITQAAKAMRLSPKTVRRHIKQGKIPYKLVPGKYGDEYRITELPPQRLKEQTLDTTPTLALDIVQRLEQENRNLAGQLGAAHERIRTLENQIKLLTAGKQPWWRRLSKLFKRMV
jgi:excisionase family DNA binding protein